MPKKKLGEHKNSGKCCKIKISKSWWSSATHLQHALDHTLISWPLKDNRYQTFLIEPLDENGNSFWIETLVHTTASRMHQREYPSPWNPYMLKTGATLFDKN
ncbi:MAG: hypothetical protein U0223_13620 [Nitrospira sp.]